MFLSVVHDFEPGFDTYTEKPGYRVQADLGLDEVVPEEYDGLGLARRPGPRILEEPPRGGRDRAALPRNRQADRGQLPRTAPARSRPAAPSGTTMTCLSRSRARPASAGAKFVNREVVVDGSLVTVRGWPDNGPWMKEFVRLLKGAK